MRALKLFSGVTGTLVTLTAIPLLIAGIVLFAIAADGDRTDLPTFDASSRSRALVVDDIDLHTGWFGVGDVTIVASDDDDLFIGVGPADDVERFLRGDGDPRRQTFWVVDDLGSQVSVDWNVDGGHWSAVVMNADGTPGVDARIDVAIPSWPIRLAAFAVSAVAVVVGGFGAGLMWLAWRRTAAVRDEPAAPEPIEVA